VEATAERPFNIGRGLFRLCLALSFLWLIGASFAYRPPACRHTPPGSLVRAVGPNDLRQCIRFVYERATLDGIPARLPTGQEGLDWADLTNAQQSFAIYSWRTSEGALTPAQAEKRYGSALYNGFDPPAGVTPITRDEFAGDPEVAAGGGNADKRRPLTWTDVAKEIERTEEAKSHPENYHYRLIPILPYYANHFREELLKFPMVTLGIPFAVGLAGLLIFRMGRWVRSGFSSPP
jgi:hypothetical protein